MSRTGAAACEASIGVPAGLPASCCLSRELIGQKPGPDPFGCAATGSALPLPWLQYPKPEIQNFGWQYVTQCQKLHM